MGNATKQPPVGLMMFWGILWLVATLGGPVAVLMLTGDHENAALWSGGAALALHLLASRMIVHVDALCGECSDSKQFSNWLILGGWALMIGVFFAGCVSAFKIGL